MFQIKNVTLIHKKDLRTILENFSLVLNDGDKAVLIGEEGNGKSTLMKWIFDPQLVEEYIEATGEKAISGEKLGYLPQELPASEKTKTVCEYFMESLDFLDQTPKELSKLASDFGVEAEFFYREQEMKTLSGGERVKAQMMRILIEKPTILLLDEPSNDIDIETLELMERLINQWEHAVLFISHDETLIEHTANRVIHFEQIRRKTRCRHTVANMPYRRYVEERLSAFEKQEQIALGERREKRIRDEKIRRMEQSVGARLDNISKGDRDAIGRLLKKKMKNVKAMEKRFEREDAEMTERPEQEEAIFFKLGNKDSAIPSGKWVLQYENHELTTADGGRTLAHAVELKLRGSEKIGIIGTNGCGKTTLLTLLAKELLARQDLRAEYMPQNYEALLDMDMTPVDFLDDSGDKEERTRIRTYLGSLKYTADEMEHPIRELSGGQKAKVLLLKLSMSGANVLILDEPTRNFSPLSGPVIRKMLREFPGAIISVSHDRKYLSEVCDKIYRLTPDGLRGKESEDIISREEGLGKKGNGMVMFLRLRNI
ncbi:MAG: ABC-F family ATP-binding cassette domain-containing protein [Lachnospiraceae bacterium]|nr:ABC-F family ATP-binding cassette domain-containing protein [Lachnospiraceae bacterium]